MFDPSAYERQLTAAAVIEQLDTGQAPDLGDNSVAALTDILSDPWALNEAGDEKPFAAGLIWRLGVAHDMSRLVLTNVVNLSTSDPELLQSASFTQGRTIARGLLRTDPRLLEHMDERDARAFWGLTGYDPASYDEDDPFGILSSLEVLQDAAYIPETVVTQMLHHRDNSSTMRHDPQLKGMAVIGDSFELDVDEPEERERELTEATVRTVLGAFIARYTGEDSDRRVAAVAVEDFTVRALVDVAGMASAISLAATLDGLGIAQDERMQGLVHTLRERISGFASSVELADTPMNDLSDLAGAVYTFAEQTPSVALHGLLARIASRLEDYEALYAIGGDPHLVGQSVLDHQNMMQVSQAYSAKENLAAALRLLRGEPAAPVQTPERVLNDLTTDGFSTQLVHAAFRLTSAELDQDRKAQLLADFDAAIGATLARLSPDHALSKPNALDMLSGNIDLGTLARFPSGRRFIADRTRAYADLVNQHLLRPDAWLNGQDYPDFIAAGWLNTLHDALNYNQVFFTEAGAEAMGILTTVQAAVAGVLEFIDLSTAQAGTIRMLARSGRGLVTLIDEARMALYSHFVLGRHAIQPQSPPVLQLLDHYRHMAR